MKRYRVEVRPITPIHIGTGREIGLLEYKVIGTENQSSAGISQVFDRPNYNEN